jgi:hypothetical protein
MIYRDGSLKMSASVKKLTEAVVGSAARPRINKAGNWPNHLGGQFGNVSQKILCSSETCLKV